MVFVEDEPLREALRVALPLDAIVPLVAVKAAEVELAGTVTDAGTDKIALFEDSATVLPPEGAALESVTVQEVVAFDARAEAAQFSEDRLMGTIKETTADAEEPVIEAVTVPL